MRNEKCEITTAASVATAYAEAACDIQWRREAGAKGAYAPGGTFQGRGGGAASRKIKKIWPVYDRTSLSQLLFQIIAESSTQQIKLKFVAKNCKIPFTCECFVSICDV